MPRYIYRCEECEIVFQSIHSIREKLTDCKECDAEGGLRRIPTMPTILSKKQDEQKRHVGSLVEEFIEDAREDLKEEKRELGNQVYEDE